MIPETVAFSAGLLLALALTVLTTLLQTLYLESLRLRKRETEALSFFKETLEPRLSLKPEVGALAFSLIKHTLILLIALLVLGVAHGAGQPLPQALVEAGLFGFLGMLGSAFILPQLFYRKSSCDWLLPLVPGIRLLVKIVSPLTSVLSFLHMLSELGKREGETENGASDQIDALITAGEETGIIEKDDRKLIESVVAFGDKTVREVMTPRPRIVAIQKDKTLEELRQLVIHEQYSRIPVYEDSIDNVVGFVHVRDMFEMDYAERGQRTVGSLMRQIAYVPDTMPVSELLRNMQDEARHISVVVDEYGNTAGLVTMEDLVEEILGEIRDEHEPGSDVTEEPGGSIVVAGSFDLDGLKELLGFRAPEGTESTTIGGLVTEWMGRVPKAGEAVEREGIRIEVLSSNDVRVEQVRASRLVQAENVESGHE